jgi:hypothetical protein
MGGPSSENIRFINQNKKEQTQAEGYVMREAGKKRTLQEYV